MQSASQRGRRGLGLARVTGVSMEPTLRDGDLLLVRWGARPRAGRLAVVQLPGGRPLSVKRLGFAVPQGWWVERDNPDQGVDSWAVGAVADSDVLAVSVWRLPRWVGGLGALSGRVGAARRRPSRPG